MVVKKLNDSNKDKMFGYEKEERFLIEEEV